MRTRAFLAVALLAFGFVAAIPGQVWAEDSTMSWSFRSNHPNVVQLEFYSQHRNAAWPGAGRAYVLDDYGVQTFNLNCWQGEKICYGAWVDGDANEYWGVGIDDSQDCYDCCVTCQNGYAGTRNLNP
jgi:hypothetical protein